MSRPLDGRRVVVTRPVAQSTELVRAIEALGGRVVELPLTRIEPLTHDGAIATAISRLEQYGIVVVTSANGANCFVDAMTSLGATLANGTALVAVGAATADVLRGSGLSVDVIPPVATGQGILEALADRALPGVRVLLPRARDGRPEVPAGLRAAGALVDDVAFYETVRCPVDPGALDAARLADVFTLTAPSGVDALRAVVSEPSRYSVVTIGPTTSGAAQAAGFHVLGEATEQSAAGIVRAVCAAVEALPGPGAAPGPER